MKAEYIADALFRRARENYKMHGTGRTANACLLKYFGVPEITEKERVNILKNMLFTCTMKELRNLTKIRNGIPVCIKLFIQVLADVEKTGDIEMIKNLIGEIK
jgi:hypothetical protein